MIARIKYFIFYYCFGSGRVSLEQGLPNMEMTNRHCIKKQMPGKRITWQRWGANPQPKTIVALAEDKKLQ